MVPRHQQLIHHSVGGGGTRSSSNSARQKPPSSSLSSRRSLPLQTPCWLSAARGEGGARGGGGGGARGGGLTRSLSYSKQDPHQRIVTSSYACHAAAASNESADDILLRQQTSPPNSSSKGPFQQAMMHALGPTALLSGTAVFYSAVYRHPACTLSPLSAFYLLLLALQTSIQPRLSRKFIKPSTNQQAVALTEEIVKTIFAAGLFFGCQERSVIQHSIQDWSIASSLAVAGIPSVLYAAQGVLTYTSHQHLNAVTFNGLSQTKTVSAALFCYLLLGTRQSRVQMLAIFILFISALIFQGLLIVVRPQVVIAAPKQEQSSSSTLSSPEKDDTATRSSCPLPPTKSATNSDSRDSTWFAKGIVPCLGATFLSGLAGAFSQRGLQLVGGTGGRNAFLFTIEVSFYSALSLVVSMVWNNHYNSRNKKSSIDAKTRASFSWNKIWSHRSDIVQALIPITVKAMGGIVTALVHKHAGSVLKGFALVLGLVLSGLLQTVMDEESLTVNQGIGTLLVMLSSWMHFTNPPTM